MDTLSVTPKGDFEIEMKRAFHAPRSHVFRALTEPALVQRWLLGPDGWTMPVCEIDLRVGGRYRYVWHNEAKRIDMGVSGSFLEIVPPERIVHREQFDDPWYEGEAIVTTLLEEKNGRTTMTMTMALPTREARDGVLKSGMEKGVSRSFERMAEILAKE